MKMKEKQVVHTGLHLLNPIRLWAWESLQKLASKDKLHTAYTTLGLQSNASLENLPSHSDSPLPLSQNKHYLCLNSLVINRENHTGMWEVP